MTWTGNGASRRAPQAERVAWPILGLTVAILLLLCSGPAGARDAEGSVVHGQGLLWRIEAEDGAVSHLFGTLHSTDPEVTALPWPVEQALEQASSLALEVDLDDEAKLRFARSMILSPADGVDLAGLAGPRLFSRVRQLGGRYGMSDDQLRRFKPWALTVTFSFPLAELKRQCCHQALDETLLHRARSRGLPVRALETIDEQIEIFDGLPAAAQVAFLDAAITENGRIDSWWRTMKDAYLRRDVGDLFEMSLVLSRTDDSGLNALFLERVLDQRNERMAGRMIAHLRAGGIFVAVGALHLPGEEGLVSLLQAEGFKLSRVY